MAFNLLLCYFRWYWRLMFSFLGRYGVTNAGGCRDFTGMLHGKMVGIRALTVPSLLSKCKLQILVFSIGFLMLTSHLYLWSGSWGRRWNFTSSHSRLSLLLEQPGMLQIWYRGMGWCLTVQLSSHKSWNCTQGQIHGKKFKHMKHNNISKTSTLSYKLRVFTLNTLSYTIKLTYIN